MTTKERLLELFENNKGKYFSGEEIAKELNISRSAVWKAVHSLRCEGYDIKAVSNKGYSLSTKTDILSPQGIEKYLSEDCRNMNITVLSSVDSTNARMKKLADEGAEEGCILVSNNQSRGRGRFGKSFYSPMDTGIYMSILLRPRCYDGAKAVSITTMGAVAMCESIMNNTSVKPKIKWVNDIFAGGKKVCGILTEGAFDIESGMLRYAVLGVGLNVYSPKGGFPEDIRDIAGSLLNEPCEDIKNRIVADFINNFMRYYRSEDKSIYTQKYRELSFVIGRKVMTGEDNRVAEVTSIDDDCRLCIQYENGECKKLSYGEIRIKF